MRFACNFLSSDQPETFYLSNNRFSNATVDPARQCILAGVIEVEATDSKPAHEVLTVKCLLCDSIISTWSSWVRVRGHLSGDGSLTLATGTVACTNVPQDVARKFKDIINATHEQKRQRDAEMRGRAAVDAAGASGGGGGGGGGSGAAAAANKRQKSIEAAFDTPHRAEMDEAVAKFFMGCDVSFQIVGHPLFKRMIDKAKTAGPSYKPQAAVQCLRIPEPSAVSCGSSAASSRTGNPRRRQ